jgi:hypothetical protein
MLALFIFAAGAIMSGPNRFEHERKPTKVKRNPILILFVFGFVALGIVVSLLLARHGWAIE